MSVASAWASGNDPAPELAVDALRMALDETSECQACLRQQFPSLPLIGTYGTGQIVATAAGGGRLLRNAVVTILLHR